MNTLKQSLTCEAMKEAKHYADNNGYWFADEEERLYERFESLGKEDDDWVIVSTVHNVENIADNTDYNIVSHSE